MKNTFILLFFLTSNISLAQFQIESNFNSVAVGRNQSLLLNYNLDRFQVGLGVKYSFNKLVDFPKNKLYGKAFFAIKPSEYWGLELNLKYKLISIKDVFITHLFFNTQFTISHTRFENFYLADSLVQSPSSEFVESYKKQIVYYGPFLVFENNIGLAFEIFLSENFYLSQKFGGGIVVYTSLKNSSLPAETKNWEFSEMLSFGIGYKFNKKVHNRVNQK